MVPLPASITQRVAEIQNDNTSGATSLTSRTAEIFHDWARGMPPLSSADAFAQLITLATSLCQAQPMMAPLVHLSSELLTAADRCTHSAEIAQTVLTLSRQFVKQLHARLEAVANNAAEIIPDKSLVLTHSSSSSVFEALMQASERGKHLRVFCTESRPMREGVTLARRLNAANIPATLLVDSAAFTVLPTVQIILVGGDAVTSEGLTNKIGTYGLAVAAQSMNKPIYALCDSTKFLPASYPLPDQPERDPHEVLTTPLPGISVMNYYFDRTPLELLTGIITEEAVLSVPHVKDHLSRIPIHPQLVSRLSTLYSRRIL